MIEEIDGEGISVEVVGLTPLTYKMTFTTTV